MNVIIITTTIVIINRAKYYEVHKMCQGEKMSFRKPKKMILSGR